jgi:hypothetical protein
MLTLLTLEPSLFPSLPPFLLLLPPSFSRFLAVSLSLAVSFPRPLSPPSFFFLPVPVFVSLPQDHLYTQAQALGITLLTVAHRQALWKHHEYLLMLDGKGGWSFR